jgi:NADH-quinone oxidoreductase subunit M
MFSHGVIGALLFAVAGRMIYARTHTRDLDVLAPMQLSRALPFAAFAFVVASAASMGIPGFSGFAAEITILIGTWRAFPLAVWITGIGMVLVAAFTLRALTKSFFGDRTAAGEVHALPPITMPEKLGAILLISATIAIGVYPKLLLDRILPAVQAMSFLQ